MPLSWGLVEMNMSNTDFDHENTDFQEEWLSAYLDGELSSQQRTLVEQRVSEDPAMAAILDDLRKVRSLVSSLPRWDAGELSAAAIIARADEVEELDSDFPQRDDAAHDQDALPLDDVDSIVHREPLGGTTDEEFLTARLTRRTSYMRWLRPAAMAASLLLIAGVGYTLWPDGPRSELAVSTRMDSARTMTREATLQKDASDALVPEMPLPAMESELAFDSSDKGGGPPLTPPTAADSLPAYGGFGGGQGGEPMELSLPDASESFAMDAAQANLADLPSPTLDPQMDSVARQPESRRMEMEGAGARSFLEAPDASSLAPKDSVVGSSSPSRSMYFARSSAWSEDDVKAAITTSPELFGEISRSKVVVGPNAPGRGSGGAAPSTAILTLVKSDTSGTYDSLLSEAAWLAPIEELNAISGSISPATVASPRQQIAPATRPDLGRSSQAIDELPPPATFRQSKPLQIGLIALFVTKNEADDLLQNSAQSQTAAAKPGAVFWILAGPSSGRPLQGGDRVILLLNSAAR